MDLAVTFMVEPDREKIKKYVANAIKKAEPYVDDFELYDVNNNHKWVRAIGKPIINDSGEVISLHGTFQDITEEKLRSLERDEMKKRLENMLRLSPLITYECINNQSWTMTYLSPYFETLTGYKCNDFINDAKFSLNDIIYVEDQSMVSSVVASALARNQSFELRYRIIDSKNIVRWIWEKGNLDPETGKLIGIMIDITEEVKSQKSLKNLRDALDVSAIIAFTDERGLITFANSRFSDISGYSNEELVGSNHRILNSQHHPKSFFKDLWSTIKSGRIWRGQIKNKNKNGSYYWVETIIYPIKNDRGDVEQYFSFRTDITHIKEQELVSASISEIRANYIRYLNERNDFFNFLLEKCIELTQSEYGFIGEVLIENGAPLLRTTAISDISWDTESKKFYDDHRESGIDFKNLNTIFGTVLKTSKSYISNFPETDPNRGGLPSKHPALKCFMGIPIKYRGEFIAMLGLANRPGGYSEDLIKRYQSLFDEIGEIISIYKLELVNMEKQEQLELMAHSSELGVWSWNLKSNHVVFSDRYCEIIGYKQDEFKNDFETWKKNVHPEDLSYALESVEKYILGKSLIYEVKFRMKHKLGHYVPILAKGKITQRDHENKPINFAGTHFDLTYLDNIEKNLESQKKMAEHQAKLASIGQLAAGVGHEINNPLAIVKGFLENIENELQNKKFDIQKVESFVKKSQTATDRINVIVKGLRSLSRIDQDMNEMIDLKDVIRESYDLVYPLFQKEGVQIKMNLDLEFGPKIKGNRGRILQVIMNLLSNAKDATEEMSQRNILINMESVGKKIHLCVHDSGTGISENLKDKIFDPFFTTKSHNKGTGLGLSLVNNIIKEHKGEIQVDKSELGGAKFCLIFDSSESQCNAKEQVIPFKSLPKKLSGHILIVDDEEDLREIFSDLLTGFGLTVDQAVNGEDALLKIKSTNYHLVISDIKMPVMDGFELFQQIINLKLDKKVKFFFSTGGVDVDLQNKHRAMLNKVSGIITKPYEEELVFEKLNQALLDKTA